MEKKDSKKKTFKVATLGCRTNQYESQAYRDQLEAMGYRLAGKGEAAEICIVNTCTVTEAADADSRHQIRRLARENPGSQLLVTGCMAEGQPNLVKGMPGVAYVVPNLEKDRLLDRIFPAEDLPEFNIKRFEAHTRAFVKVQDGCNSFCSYCVIPYVRGRSRSRPVKDILEEIEGLVTNGFKEIVLTGINIGDFDGAGKDTLADLVREVDKVEGVERIRVSSIDPDEVDDDLLNAIVSGQKTCQSMHIVLQAGSNVVLKRMNRKYTRHCFIDTVERLRAASPDFTFTTDIIVGFPGETDYDFEETLDVMREVRFAKVHMFPYSERPRTRSARFKDKVSPNIVTQRKREVMRVAEQIAFDLRNDFVGRRMAILTEGHDLENGTLTGHTDNFLLAYVEGEGLQRNELVEVILQENTPRGFRATLVMAEKKVS